MSVDILSFFKQLLPVLENDESVYCLSAWNDQVIKPCLCIRDLKIRLRRRRRQQHGVEVYSRFYQSSSRLFKITYFVKCRRTPLELNYKEP